MKLLIESMGFTRVFFILTLVLFGTVTAAAEVEVASFANGEHSFRSLGPAFSSEISVRRIPDNQIQLAFVNYLLAERLGIRLPKDPKELEALAKEQFGYEVDPTGQSPKKWFATRYLDSVEKGEGHAMGDGRALWTGELKLETNDGRHLYVDSVLKGVGQTPFAWLKNSSHSDGKQSIDEMVNSAFLSLASERNQLDTTSDLFGFRVIKDGEVKSMTLRLGNQTRVAHPSYHSDKKADFKKIMDYIVVRDLGLALETPVTKELKSKWLAMFTKNVAEEAARFFDLDLIQESPTNGNKTSRGGTVDLAGLRYLDAYHTEYRHLFLSLKVQNQNAQMKIYLDRMVSFMKKAGYISILSHPFLMATLGKQYQDNFAKEFGRLSLQRLGISSEEVARLSESTIREFLASLISLKTAVGTIEVDMPGGNKKIAPAAFETRSLLAKTFSVLARTPNATDEIFAVERRWKSNAKYEDYRDAYLNSVRKIMSELGTITPYADWIARATRVGSHKRKDLIRVGGFYDRYTGQAVEIARGGRLGFQEVTQLIESAADELADPELLERPITMLKAKPPVRLVCPAAFGL